MKNPPGLRFKTLNQSNTVIFILIHYTSKFTSKWCKNRKRPFMKINWQMHLFNVTCTIWEVMVYLVKSTVISRYQLVNPGGEGLYAVKLKVVKVENENVSHFWSNNVTSTSFLPLHCVFGVLCVHTSRISLRLCSFSSFLLVCFIMGEFILNIPSGSMPNNTRVSLFSNETLQTLSGPKC